MVRSADVCIDRHEAALVELDGVGALVGSWSPYVNPGSTRVRAVSLRGAVPQGHISQVQAASACAEAGKRLCSDVEWLRACQGSAATTYPYGDAKQPGVCNDARALHPAIEYFGTAEAWIWSELGNACITQIPASLDITGQNAGCVSEDGALDMMGNLHEWTADPAGTFRGGFFVDTAINGPGCLYKTTAHDVTHHDYSTGFRCCAD
jgi:sulfatase modifying factor 1